MAVIKEKIYPKTSNFEERSEIKFVCPICKTAKKLNFPSSVIYEAKQLTTISIPKGLICQHHFQAFVDKNFFVRGYQKVDYEFKFESSINSNSSTRKMHNHDNEVFNYLILEGNYVKCNLAKKSQELPLVDNSETPLEKLEDEDLTLRKIYEEFWEFIDEGNLKFKRFIEKDLRRKHQIKF